ncbi:MAG: tRNA (cytidine(34)-2'-O)-methyltransferase [Bdellovibrionota bacterium]
MPVRFHIVLVNPLIPQNTGNVGRLAAATDSVLHLVHPLGFQITEARVKRAGLDYWPWIKLVEHKGIEEFLEFARSEHPASSLYLFSKKASRLYTEARFKEGDFLVFGRETTGLPADFVSRFPDTSLKIPIFNPNVRSLNLSNAVSVALYEAIRQTGE